MVLAWVAVVVQQAVRVGRLDHLHQDGRQLTLQAECSFQDVSIGLCCDVPVDPQMLKCGSTVDPWSKNTVLSIDMKERKNFKYQVFMEILYFLLGYSDFL